MERGSRLRCFVGVLLGGIAISTVLECKAADAFQDRPVSEPLDILVVCTGNTCRSPMAERLLKRAFAERLECSEDQLEENGIIVRSAGTDADVGSPGSTHSVTVMEQMGIDLGNHASQPVTDELVNEVDLILAMTARHQQKLTEKWPESAERIHLFDTEQNDVVDPFGESQDVYQACAEQLQVQAGDWVNKIMNQRDAKESP